MNCIRCHIETEEEVCGECPTCQAVSKTLVVIFAKWSPSEIEELAKHIRGNTTDNLINEFQGSGRFLSAQICRLIRHLGLGLKNGADHLKSKVCDALLKQAGHEKACVAWMEKNNITFEESRRMLAKQISISTKGALEKVS